MADQAIQMALSDLDAISPFHLVVDPSDRIMAHGRMLRQLFGRDSLVGDAFGDAFRLIKPHGILPSALGATGTAVKVRTRPEGELVGFNLPGVALRAMSVEGAEMGVLMMLTPGLEIQRMVEHLNLRMADLSPADSSTDLLFLIETQVQLLHNAIENSVRVDEARQEAERRAESDWLTGIFNRRGFMERLQKHLENRDEKGCGLIHIDLDRFKMINDMHGHAAGDALLKHVAHILENHVAQPRYMGRIGGDEFVVACPFETTIGPTRQLAEQLALALRTAIDWNGTELKVHATFGIAFAEAGEPISSDDLLHQADVAMLAGKRLGRGGVHMYAPAMARGGFDLPALAEELSAGRETGELHALFESLCDPASGHLRGLEIREIWLHPTHGRLAAETFRAAAELVAGNFEVIRDIRAEAFADLAALRRSGFDIPDVWLNLSADELSAPGTPGHLEWLVCQHGFETEQVTLEIADQVLARRYGDSMRDDFAAYAERGFRLSLVGLGATATPLESLITLPIDQFKIDKRFMPGLLSDPVQTRLVEAMIGLGRTLGLEVVVGGVETADAGQWLAERGCALIQGPLVAPCVSSRELSDLLGRSEAARAL